MASARSELERAVAIAARSHSGRQGAILEALQVAGIETPISIRSHFWWLNGRSVWLAERERSTALVELVEKGSPDR